MKAAPTATPGDGLLGDGRVAHPPLAELGQQALRDLVGALVRADLLAEDEDVRVARHLLLEGLVQRLAHGDEGHGYLAFPEAAASAAGGASAGGGRGGVHGGSFSGTRSSRLAARQAGSFSAFAWM